MQWAMYRRPQARRKFDALSFRPRPAPRRLGKAPSRRPQIFGGASGSLGSRPAQGGGVLGSGSGRGSALVLPLLAAAGPRAYLVPTTTSEVS